MKPAKRSFSFSVCYANGKRKTYIGNRGSTQVQVLTTLGESSHTNTVSVDDARDAYERVRRLTTRNRKGARVWLEKASQA